MPVAWLSTLQPFAQSKEVASAEDRSQVLPILCCIVILTSTSGWIESLVTHSASQSETFLRLWLKHPDLEAGHDKVAQVRSRESKAIVRVPGAQRALPLSAELVVMQR